MKFRDRIECNDGFTVSIQASSGHYCMPRDDVGPYSHVEIGFPSMAPIAEIMEYAEDQENPCDTVYAYVPVELAAELLRAHGGPTQHQDFLVE